MPGRYWAPAERASLCDLLDAAGPDAPTLPPGRSTGDLAVHLVAREVLRAAGPPAPPARDPGRDAAVFDQLRARAGWLGRRIPSGVGLLVRSAEHGAVDVRRGPALLVVDGAPVELALWLFGRPAAAA